MRATYAIPALVLLVTLTTSVGVRNSPRSSADRADGIGIPASLVEHIGTASRVSRDPVVTVEPVEERIVTSRLRLFGRIGPRDEMLVGPQLDGIPIVDVLVDTGDLVEKGQVIAVLDRVALRARLAQSEAELAKAEANIAQAQAAIVEAEVSRDRAASALDRALRLFASGSMANQALDDRRADAAAAEARLTAQRHRLRSCEAERRLASARHGEAGLNLEYAQIKAPDAGIVSYKAASIGQIASSAGEPLFRIIRNGELEMHAEAVDKTLPLLMPGQTAEVRISGVSEAIAGRVRLIGPVVDGKALTARVWISFDRVAGVRSGLFAHALVDAGRNRALTVAHSAVQKDDSGSVVKIVNDGIVETRRVLRGPADDAGVAILSGLLKGELVVVRAGALLRDGDRVIASIAAGVNARREVR